MVDTIAKQASDFLFGVASCEGPWGSSKCTGRARYFILLARVPGYGSRSVYLSALVQCSECVLDRFCYGYPWCDQTPERRQKEIYGAINRQGHTRDAPYFLEALQKERCLKEGVCSWCHQNGYLFACEHCSELSCLGCLKKCEQCSYKVCPYHKVSVSHPNENGSQIETVACHRVKNALYNECLKSVQGGDRTWEHKHPEDLKPLSEITQGIPFQCNICHQFGAEPALLCDICGGHMDTTEHFYRVTETPICVKDGHRKDFVPQKCPECHAHCCLHCYNPDRSVSGIGPYPQEGTEEETKEYEERNKEYAKRGEHCTGCEYRMCPQGRCGIPLEMEAPSEKEKICGRCEKKCTHVYYCGVCRRNVGECCREKCLQVVIGVKKVEMEEEKVGAI